MRRLPWHVTLLADRKAILTAIGISLGACFAFLGLAIPQALDVLSADRDAFVGSETFVVANATGDVFLIPAELRSSVATRVLLVTMAATPGGDQWVATMGGKDAILVAPGDAVPVGSDRAWPREIELAGPHAGGRVTIADGISSRNLPPGTLVVSPETFEKLTSIDPATHASFVLTPSMDVSMTETLHDRGLQVVHAPAISRFFRESGREIAVDLALVVTFSSILVAVLSYEFLRSEVHERRREIGLWRGLGLRQRDVVQLLVGRATAIAAAGSLLGLVAAIVLLAGGRALTGIAVIRPDIEVAPAVVVLLSLVAAGVLGASVPALAAARAPVRDALEAPA